MRRKPDYQRSIYVLLAIVVIEAVFLIASCRKQEVIRPAMPKPKAERKKVQPKVNPVRNYGAAQKKQDVSGGAKSKEQSKPLRAEAYPAATQGKIAIVLDDWGYNLNNVELLKQIDAPLTLAILPRRAYSVRIAELAKEFNKEVILHLPMEPHREKQYQLEPDTLLITMSKQEILKILEMDFKSVPGLKGISNHMGSQATESEDLMRVIFEELKKKKLYFLDSFTGKTVCPKLALEAKLPYARRNVFLDNKSDAEYIQGQLEALAKTAKQDGFAVGIGHDRKKTLEVLVQAIPELKKRGFRFVYTSELAK